MIKLIYAYKNDMSNFFNPKPKIEKWDLHSFENSQNVSCIRLFSIMCDFILYYIKIMDGYFCNERCTSYDQKWSV